MSERQQQIAEAIWTADGDPWQLASDEDRAQAMEWAAAVEPFLVAAEQAGYERCKQDAATAIKALPAVHALITHGCIRRPEALAVVAALGQQQESE